MTLCKYGEVRDAVKETALRLKSNTPSGWNTGKYLHICTIDNRKFETFQSIVAVGGEMEGHTTNKHSGSESEELNLSLSK